MLSESNKYAIKHYLRELVGNGGDITYAQDNAINQIVQILEGSYTDQVNLNINNFLRSQIENIIHEKITQFIINETLQNEK